MKNLTLDETAWRGAIWPACSSREPIATPFPFEDERSWAWASGYIEGKANPDTLAQMRTMPKHAE